MVMAVPASYRFRSEFIVTFFRDGAVAGFIGACELYADRCRSAEGMTRNEIAAVHRQLREATAGRKHNLDRDDML